jgi:hypothetical protein
MSAEYIPFNHCSGSIKSDSQSLSDVIARQRGDNVNSLTSIQTT